MTTTTQMTESQIAASKRDDMAKSAYMRDVCVRDDVDDRASAFQYSCDLRRADMDLRGE